MTIELDDGIRLVGGSMFSPSRPDESTATIEDVATALSNCCRFAGHLPYHYSVAQHSLNCSYIVDEEFAFTALMHDTAEAIINDIPTPIKYAVPELKELETRIETFFAERFGFQFPLPPEVKLADLQMLQIEKLYIKRDYSEWGVLEGIKSEHLMHKVWIAKMSPEEARERFLARYKELFNGKDNDA